MQLDAQVEQLPDGTFSIIVRGCATEAQAKECIRNLLEETTVYYSIPTGKGSCGFWAAAGRFHGKFGDSAAILQKLRELEELMATEAKRETD